MHEQSNEIKAISFTITYCFLNAVMISIVKYISEDIHPFQVVFLRNFFGLLLFLPFMIKAGKTVFKTNHKKLYAIRAALSTTAMFLWFYAITKVDLSITVSVSFIAPLIAIALASVVFKEKSELKKWIALAVGFIGVLVVLRPGAEGFNPYALLVLAATLFWGVSAIIVKKLSHADDHKTVVFFMVLIMAPLSLPPALFYWQSISTELLLWLIALAAVSNISQVALTKALSLAAMKVTQPFDFTRLIFTSIIAYFAFGEILDTWTIVGSLIIMSSVIYSVRLDRKKQRVKITLDE